MQVIRELQAGLTQQPGPFCSQTKADFPAVWESEAKLAKPDSVC